MKNSVFILITVLCSLFLFSCFHKQSKNEVVENLKTAMNLYLNHQPRIDTSRVKFNVLEVTFFEGKLGYTCNFKVNMREKRGSILTDTTGFMSANVSKDFKDVSRRD
jgi:hypothetical protein